MIYERPDGTPAGDPGTNDDPSTSIPPKSYREKAVEKPYCWVKVCTFHYVEQAINLAAREGYVLHSIHPLLDGNYGVIMTRPLVNYKAMKEPTQEQLLTLWNAFTEFEKKEQTDDEWSSLAGIIETDYGNYGDVAIDSYEYGRRTLLRELRQAINEVQNES